MNIFNPALNFFILRQLPFDAMAFPRWQAIAAISLIGLLIGFDPSMRAGTPEMPGMPLFVAIPFGVLSIWAAFLVIVGVLKWWLNRGSRWDGSGDLFNLIAASWLVADVLGAGLTALGVPPLLTLPLWLYSVWVGGNALSGTIPKASLGYAIGGIALGLIPAMIVSVLVIALAGFALTVLGVTPEGSHG